VAIVQAEEKKIKAEWTELLSKGTPDADGAAYT